jgi:hypothetical protein
MADNGTKVEDLKVSVVKISEVKISQNGKAYIQISAVHEGGEDKTWFSAVAFGGVARALSKHLAKGNKMKVNGTVSQKEYMNKEGKPGVENKLIINTAVVAGNDGVVTIDEFTA